MDFVLKLFIETLLADESTSLGSLQYRLGIFAPTTLNHYTSVSSRFAVSGESPRSRASTGTNKIKLRGNGCSGHNQSNNNLSKVTKQSNYFTTKLDVVEPRRINI